MTISDKAVEAAAEYLSDRFFWSSPLLREVAREVLEAAAPHMLADAWDEGAHSGWLDDGAFEVANPYRPTP